MVKTMNKLLAIFLVFAMAIANASFIDTTLTTAGTEETLSTMTPVSMNGSNTFVSFNSSSSRDTQNITIRYMNSDYDQKVITYALTGTTSAQTDGLNYIYVLKNSTTTTQLNTNTTSQQLSSMYWNLFTTNQPLRTASHTLTVTNTGNAQDDLMVYLNGVNVGNITKHAGSTTATFASVSALKGNNNVTVSIASPHSFTETKSNTTAKTGGTGTQTISFTTSPLAAQSNITIYADIPALSGTETKYDTDEITISQEVIGEEIKTNSVAFSHNDSTEDKSITLVNSPVKRTGGYDYSYVIVNAENVSGEVLVSANGDYVGALVNNGTTMWGRDMSDPTEKFLVGANNISFSGTGYADVINVSLDSFYLATPSSIDGNHSVTMTKAGTGNLTIVMTKTGACEVSVSLNGVWKGNLTGVTTTGTWAGTYVVGVNNITYGYATSCLDSKIKNATATNAWAETFTVSLNGATLGTMASSPSTWNGVTVVTGVNNVSYSSSDTSGNLTNSSIKVLYNDFPIVTAINLNTTYFTTAVATKFEMSNTNNNWTFLSSGDRSCSYANVYHVVATSLKYTTTATPTSAATSTNTDDGTTATLYSAPIKYIYIEGDTYLTELWYRDANGNRVIVQPYRLVNCTNATLTNNGTTSDITATQYARSGTKTSEVTDIAYIFSVKLSSVAIGNVEVYADDGSTILYTVSAGNTTPTSNGGTSMCTSSSGCVVSNLWYGGDALWKMTVRVFAHDGTNRTALSVFQSAGTGNYGDGTVRFGAGENVVFYGLPYTSGMNVSLYYEAR